MPTDLDAPMTASECARWLRIDPQKLRELVQTGKVPAMRLSARGLRFHPRSVLVALKQPGATGGVK